VSCDGHGPVDSSTRRDDGPVVDSHRWQAYPRL
jgi:hypothetical protein